jgi:hypothetical protein
VWKNRLEELQLPTGQWLTELKRRVRAGAPDDAPIGVYWRTREGSRVRSFSLGELKRNVLDFVPGQKLCYVTDVAGHERNSKTLVEIRARFRPAVHRGRFSRCRTRTRPTQGASHGAPRRRNCTRSRSQSCRAVSLLVAVPWARRHGAPRIRTCLAGADSHERHQRYEQHQVRPTGVRRTSRWDIY